MLFWVFFLWILCRIQAQAVFLILMLFFIIMESLLSGMLVLRWSLALCHSPLSELQTFRSLKAFLQERVRLHHSGLLQILMLSLDTTRQIFSWTTLMIQAIRIHATQQSAFCSMMSLSTAFQ